MTTPFSNSTRKEPWNDLAAFLFLPLESNQPPAVSPGLSQMKEQQEMVSKNSVLRICFRFFAWSQSLPPPTSSWPQVLLCTSVISHTPPYYLPYLLTCLLWNDQDFSSFKATPCSAQGSGGALSLASSWMSSCRSENSQWASGMRVPFWMMQIWSVRQWSNVW